MKVIFVDFDDTIGLHEQSIDNRNIIDWSDPRVLFENSNYAFRETILNTDLIDKFRVLKEKYKNNVKIIVLSMSGTYAVEKKKKWLNDMKCEDLFEDFIGLSVDLDKGQYIKAYESFYNVKPEDVILIDDARKHLMEAKPFCHTYLPHMFTLKFEEITEQVINK